MDFIWNEAIVTHLELFSKYKLSRLFVNAVPAVAARHGGMTDDSEDGPKTQLIWWPVTDPLRRLEESDWLFICSHPYFTQLTALMARLAAENAGNNMELSGGEDKRPAAK